MKILGYLFLVLGLTSNCVSAQTDTSKTKCKNDSTRMTWGEYDVILIKNRHCTGNALADSTHKKRHKGSETFSNWSGIYFGVNGFMTPSGSTDLNVKNRFLELDYSKSVTWGFNFATVKFKIVPKYISLATGLGIQWNRYGLKNNYNVFYNADSIYGVQETGVNYTVNRLKANYLQVPLIVEFRTNSKAKRAFNFGLGVIGGYKINSSLRQAYSINGVESDGKIQGHYQLNPFQFNATLRFGYGKRFNVFANYGLTSVFEKHKGPDLRPFTVGIYLPL